MNLIAIVIALAVERLLSRVSRWRQYDWFGRYLERLHGLGVLSPLRESAWGLVVLAPPLIVVAVLQSLLGGGVWSLVGLAFAVAVLVFALGPRDLWYDGRELIAARAAGDRDRVLHLTGKLHGRGAARTGDLLGAVVVAGHERILAVLFWFFLLGPLGAVLYRLASALPARLDELGAGDGLLEAAVRFHAILAWPSQRVAALLYGLAGSSDDAITGWRRAHAADCADWADRGWRVLAETGTGALQMEEGDTRESVEMDVDDHLREALGLVSRSLVLMLALLAAFTIGGWMA